MANNRGTTCIVTFSEDLPCIGNQGLIISKTPIGKTMWMLTVQSKALLVLTCSFRWKAELATDSRLCPLMLKRSRLRNKTIPTFKRFPVSLPSKNGKPEIVYVQMDYLALQQRKPRPTTQSFSLKKEPTAKEETHQYEKARQRNTNSNPENQNKTKNKEKTWQK